MKVILLEDIKGIGNRYEVKEVKGGYARNFLLPRKLVKLATPDALSELEARKAVWEKEELKKRQHLEALARNMEGRPLTFFLRVDKGGKPYGSVTKEMILSAIRDNNFVTKERVEIKLTHPIKELGEHEVDVDFKKGIRAHLKIVIRLQP